MRVIAGRLRGRSIRGAGRGGADLRPTSSRAREALFNLLGNAGYADPPPPVKMRVLDLFAGTGALGIEALSRGAVHCMFVESDPRAGAAIRANLDALDLNEATQVWQRDACKLGTVRNEPFDLALLDPPYGTDAGTQALRSAQTGGWLRPGALAVLEKAATDDAAPPEGWCELDSRRYGRARILLLRLED